MNAIALSKMLNKLFTADDNISVDVARSLVAVADKDHNAVLCFQEFSELIKDIYTWVVNISGKDLRTYYV